MAYVGQVGTLQIAGITLSLTGLKILHTTMISGTTCSTFYDASIGATRGVYQVPSGKTFQLYAVQWEAITATTNNASFQLAYFDTSLGVNSSTAETNPFGLITGIAGTNSADIFTSGQTAGGVVKSFAIGGSAPAGKFIGALQNNFLYGIVTIYGYEV
jgi:hypothetical protein